MLKLHDEYGRCRYWLLPVGAGTGRRRYWWTPRPRPRPHRNLFVPATLSMVAGALLLESSPRPLLIANCDMCVSLFIFYLFIFLLLFSMGFLGFTYQSLAALFCLRFAPTLVALALRSGAFGPCLSIIT